MHQWGYLGSEKVKDKITKALIAKAQGNFLWVKLMVDELQFNHTEEDVNRVLETLPQDMSDLYNLVIKNLRSRLTARELNLHQAILNWICLSQERLDYGRLAAILEPLGRFTTASISISLKKLCGLLVVWEESEAEKQVQYLDSPFAVYLPASYLRLLHASLMDYLLSLSPVCHFAIKQGLGHEQIAKACLSYLKTTHQSPIFYPIGSSFPYKHHYEDSGKLVAANDSRGPLPIDADDPPIDECSDYGATKEWITGKYAMLHCVKKFWAYHTKMAVKLGVDITELVNILLSSIMLSSDIFMWYELASLSQVGEENSLTDIKEFCNLLNPAHAVEAGLIQQAIYELLTITESKESRMGASLSGATWMLFIPDKNNQLLGTESENPVLALGSSEQTMIQRTFRANGDLVTAYEAFLRSTLLDSRTTLATELQSREATSNRRVVDVITDLIEAPDALWRLILIGRVLIDARELNLLYSILDACVIKFGSTAQMCMAKARLLLWLGDIEGSIRTYRSALDSASYRYDIRDILSTLLVTGNKPLEASQLFDKTDVVLHWCEKTWLAKRKADVLEDAGLYTIARSVYSQGRKDFPDSLYMARWNLEYDIRQHDFDTAISFLKTAQQRPDIRLWAGNKLIGIFIKAGQREDAQNEALEFVKNSGYHWKSYQTLWDLQDDTNMAIETFSKLTELPETRWEAYIYLAWALADAKSYEAVVAACHKSLKLKLHSSGLHMLSVAYKKLGHPPDEALSEFKAYWELQSQSNDFQISDDSKCLQIIAGFACSAHIWSDVIWSLKEISKSSPNDVQSGFTLVEAYIENGDFSLAEEQYLISMQLLEQTSYQSKL